MVFRRIWLQIRAQPPDFRKQHHVQHLAQVAHATGAAGAALEADDAFDRGGVAEAPEAEGVFPVGEFFAEWEQVEILFSRPGLTGLTCLS